jgi:hypothetical protein
MGTTGPGIKAADSPCKWARIAQSTAGLAELGDEE